MKHALRDPTLWIAVAFAAAWTGLFVLAMTGNFPSMIDGALSGDAISYDALARSLATTGMFSLDGVTPFFEREPGYSLFLAAVYGVFGLGSYGAVFAIQALLHLAASYAFVRSTKGFLPVAGPTLLFALLLLSPPAFHVMFSVTRESVSLSLAMFLTASSFALARRSSAGMAVIAGALLGALILTDMPFLLFPVGFLALLLWWRVRWTHVLACGLAIAIVIVPWVVRNEAHVDMACVTGCYRSALQWYVRGEQAEHIGIGFEPARCLWAEYVTRDWTGRSVYCNFNAVWHRQWPDGFVGVPADADVASAGQAKIFAHLPNYLWFSLFEIVELHLPYVNGWGRTYNLAAILWTVVVYLGCALSVPRLRRKEYLLFAAFIAYTTALFALTDATPRYLVPVLHCYAFLAALGYTGLDAWRKRQSSSRP